MTTDELIALMSPATMASLVRDLDGRLDGSTRDEDRVCQSVWWALVATVGRDEAHKLCQRRQ